MKCFLFIAIILSVLVCKGQDDNIGLLDKREAKSTKGISNDSLYHNYILFEGQVKFEKVYEVDSLSGDELGALLTRTVPMINGVTDFRKEDGLITAMLKNAKIDYKRYGARWGTTPILLNHPFNANISILWKDGKYKATLTNITFIAPNIGYVKLDEMLTRKKGTQWDRARGATQIGGLTEQYFIDLFKLRKSAEW